MKYQTLQTAAAVFAVLATASASGAQTAAPGAAREAKEQYVLAPSKRIIGLSVHNDANKVVGEIGDLLADPKTGELRYVILEVGGFLGVNEAKRIVPFAYLNFVHSEDTDAKCIVRTNLTEAQAKAAPEWNSDSVLDKSLDERITAAFGKNPAWDYSGGDRPQYCRVSALSGVHVFGKTGTDVGTVQSVILAPQNACIAYFVVDTNKSAADKEVAVPFGPIHLAFDAEGKLLAQTTVEADRWASAPDFDSKDLKRMTSMAWVNEIAMYFGTDPFWKHSRFATARKLPK